MRRRIWAVTAALAALMAAGPAQAYYHYIYYASRAGNFNPIPAQFNLAALPNGTVPILVDDNGPSTFYPNDTFGSVLGELKSAAAAWNAVPNSALRVVFGGMETAGQTANTPGIEVEFSELPPGLLGLGTPNLPAAPALTTANGQTFVAIQRGVVLLSNNTNLGSGPSSTEQYFTTAVHEIGHALGLQHTWTASAMSQGVIRNTDRARPIDADDMASLLVLYGNTNWQANYASITGRVQLANGTGVGLASVVAIPAEGPAVSTLTDPGGNFTIAGLPPNSYQVYVHPLPPDALASSEGLLLPTDLNGVPFSASAPFTAIFSDGLLSPQFLNPWTLGPGGTVTGLTFVVQPRTAVTAYDLITLSYLDPVARTYTSSPPANYVSITPAFETISQAEMLVYSEGAPSGGGSTAVPQSVTLMGGFNPAVSCASDNSIAPCFIPYQNTAGLFSYFIPPPSPGTGPRHLVYTFANDMFVLPDAVVLVNNGPPYINAVTGNPDGSVTVTGGNFGPDSRVFFDGLAAVSTLSNTAGAITVTPPASSNGQVATVTVFNSDGQNSSFYFESKGNPPTYSLPASGTPAVFVGPVIPAIPAGGSALLTISGIATHFVSGQVTVGFGSSDIAVNNVWVLSPTELEVSVSVAPGAATGSSEISIVSGYQVITLPGAFQVLPANPALPIIAAVVNDASPLLPLAPSSGGTISIGTIYGANLAPASGSPQVTLGGTPVSLFYSSPGQINFWVPAGFPAGPATLTVNNGSASVSYGVAVANLPPTIVNVSDLTNPGSTAGPGDILAVQVTGLLDSTVQVTVSGIAMPLVSVSGGQILFVLDQSFAGSPVPIAVAVDGAASLPYTLTVR